MEAFVQGTISINSHFSQKKWWRRKIERKNKEKSKLNKNQGKREVEDIAKEDAKCNPSPIFLEQLESKNWSRRHRGKNLKMLRGLLSLFVVSSHKNPSRCLDTSSATRSRCCQVNSRFDFANELIITCSWKKIKELAGIKCYGNLISIYHLGHKPKETCSFTWNLNCGLYLDGWVNIMPDWKKKENLVPATFWTRITFWDRTQTLLLIGQMSLPLSCLSALNWCVSNKT